MRTALFAALAVLAAAPAAQAQNPAQPPAQPQSPPQDAHVRALAAGYKAAFLCSNLFNAGRTPEQAAADDLEGIYPDYQALVRTLPAEIDRAAKLVSVAFDARLPPRIAAWRPNLGCAQLPIGAGREQVARLPKLALSAPAPLSQTDARAWPDGDAQATAPAPPKLAAAVARGFDGTSYGPGARTTAVIVVRDGKIIAEQYRPDFDRHTSQRTWSAAKSMTGVLVGRAVQLGLADVNAPANIPEWRAAPDEVADPRTKITLAQLLQMNSGLWTDGPGNRTDEVYLGGALVTETAAVMPLEAAPGTRFRYANNDTLLAARSLRASLMDRGGDAQRALAFPFAELFWKIGMTRTVAETDWQGHFVLSSQVWTTARDLARLGLLLQNDGVWNGERLLPAGWAKFLASPAPAQPPQPGAGYGATFWIPEAKVGLPADAFAMSGNRGQYVYVIPSRKIVVVRRGFDPHGQRFNEAVFVRDLLAALD